MAWQGYRILHKRKCDFSGDMVISTVPQDAPYKVYRQDIWWSDTWDPKSYGRDYDFNRPFLEQWRELQLAVPLPSLMAEYSTLVSSDYCNAVATLNNCYLCFKFDNSEECAYCNTGSYMKECFDSSFCNYVELSYESTNLTKCARAFFSQDCEDSHDIWFSQNPVGCSDCVGCINLRNKSYHIFNQPYSKEEYKVIFEKYDFGAVEFVTEFQKKSDAFALTQPRRQFHGYKNQDVSGDYIYNCKNVTDSYMIRNAENIRYAELLKAGPAYNCMDYTMFALKAEWIYESCWVGIQTNNVKFSVWAYKNHDIEYCFGCMSSGNVFGCVGIRSGEYCILNKQYSKEEYNNLVPKIKKHMTAMPYTDHFARVYSYGEMLPLEFSPWAYNDTTTFEWFPTKKEEAIRQGFAWRDEDSREYKPASTEMPEHIKNVGDDILQAILKCDQCGRNYQIISRELQFLRRFNLPIPRHCPLCRDFARIKQLNPMDIFDRTCAKCGKDIQTSYSPDRPEIVYCESCYQNEVV